MFTKRLMLLSISICVLTCGVAFAVVANTMLSIPFFSQRDPRWNLPEGCAPTSMAMLLAYRGAAVDPGKLDYFLKQNSGYSSDGLIKWDVACRFAGRQWLRYEGASRLPSLPELANQLKQGKLIIAKSRRFPSHFVVVRGVTPDMTQGYIWDPWELQPTQVRIGQNGWVNVGDETRVFSIQ